MKTFPPLSLAAACLAGLLCASSAGAENQTPQFGGVLRVKAQSSWFDSNLDPISGGYLFIIDQIYDGLVRIDNNFNIIPAIAEYWKISDDGRKAVFYLRRGVRFHNGRELTADDVKFSLERVVRNTSHGRLYPYFAGKVVGADDFINGLSDEISGFRVRDAFTFEIQWTKPYVSALYLLAMSYCKILPKDLVVSQGSRFFQKPVGTGPFKFSHWMRGPHFDILGVRLERNPVYFGKRPYIDAIDFSPFYSDTQIEQGLVHLVPVVSDRQTKGDFTILTNNSLRTMYLAFSCDLPPLDQPEFRRAISLGIDKKALARVLSNPEAEFQVLNSIFPPVLPGFFPRDPASDYDPEKARLLISRWLQKTGVSRTSLDIVIVGPKTGFYAAFGRELQRQLELLNIATSVRYLKKEEDAGKLTFPFLKLVDFTMDFPDPEDIVQPLFFSGSTLNLSGCRYANDDLDRLIGLAEVESSWEKRLSVFMEMEALLARDIPAIPLFSERIRLAVLPKVMGLRPPAMGFSYLDTKDIWIMR